MLCTISLSFKMRCCAKNSSYHLINDCMYEIHFIHIFNKELDWKAPSKLKTAVTEINVIPKAEKQPDLPEKRQKQSTPEKPCIT